MKRKTIEIFSLLSTMLLLSVLAVYAHADYKGNTQTIRYFDGVVLNTKMLDTKEMDEMHDIMIQGFDFELKEQRDTMLDECTNHFKGQGNNEKYIEKNNMIAGKIFNSMMGMKGKRG